MFSRAIRSTPAGIKFKVKVNYCNIGTDLYKAGMRDNQVLKCQKLDNGTLSVTLLNGDVVIADEELDHNNDWSFKINQEDI